MSELATRLAGSNDLYAHSGRQPYASINFVTAHDGFTLNDLVSYNEKHNEANGEENRDGENNNLSWNCGVEGPTDDPAIAELRERQKRNFLATLLLSQGVPMISHGDELGAHAAGQQQRLLPGQRAHLDRLGPRRRASRRCSSSSRKLVHFRAVAAGAAAAQVLPGAEHPRRRSRTSRGSRRTAARWTTTAWNADFVRSLGMLLSGNAIEEVERARRADHRRHAAGAAERATPTRCRSRCRRSRPTSSGSGVVDTVRSDADAERSFRPGATLPAAGPFGRRVQDRSRRCANGGAGSAARRRGRT